MVFFVCNKCQETLKLKAIDIHHCNSTFCCVDCSKDFTYDAVRSHNSCVSEAEKYEKGLYKGKKVKVDPQEVWTQQISKVAETAPKHKALFQRLIGYTNVPRKAGKFINFAQNSLAVRDPKVLQEMFDIIVAAAPKKVEPEAASAGAGVMDERAAVNASAEAALAASGVGKKRKREEISGHGESADVESAPAFKIKKRMVQILEIEGKLKTKRLVKKLTEEATAAGMEAEPAAEQIESVLAKLLAKGKIVQDSSSKFTMLAYIPDSTTPDA